MRSRLDRLAFHLKWSDVARIFLPPVWHWAIRRVDACHDREFAAREAQGG